MHRRKATPQVKIRSGVSARILNRGGSAASQFSITILGYERSNDGTLIIVPEEAEIVRMIFNDYLSGMGKNAIANKLLEIGVPTKGGGIWTAWSIRRILKNEKYCGDLLLQKTYHENHITKKKINNTGQLPQS